MQFLRGYLSSVEKQWKLSWKNLTIWILLALFYASIPGITRVTVGDPSDGLKRKKFITFKEIYVEVGALVVNAFLRLCSKSSFNVLSSSFSSKVVHTILEGTENSC